MGLFFAYIKITMKKNFGLFIIGTVLMGFMIFRAKSIESQRSTVGVQKDDVFDKGYFNVSASPKQESKPLLFVKQEANQKVEKEDELDRYLENAIKSINRTAMIRIKSISDRSREWAKKLPQANTSGEKAFFEYLQVVKERDSEFEDFIVLRSMNFVRVGKSFEDYLLSCLDSLEPIEDQHVRNFILEFSYFGKSNLKVFGPIIEKDFALVKELDAAADRRIDPTDVSKISDIYQTYVSSLDIDERERNVASERQ